MSRNLKSSGRKLLMLKLICSSVPINNQVIIAFYKDIPWLIQKDF